MLRSIFFSCLFLFTATVFSQGQKFSKDELAIKQVIENESKFFWARDYKSWKKVWVHKPYVVWTAATKDGVRRYEGWKEWAGQVKDLFEESPEAMPYDGKVKKYNYSFRIYDDGAWVSFIQDSDGTKTIETRIMEREGGAWKIAMVELIFDANMQEETAEVGLNN